MNTSIVNFMFKTNPNRLVHSTYTQGSLLILKTLEDVI